MEDNRIQFRADDELRLWLESRASRTLGGSIHEQARTEIEQWRAILQLELRRIRLTLAEAQCVADVLSGSMILNGVAYSVGLVAAEVEDGFRLARENDPLDVSSYASKWGIDEGKLLEKLRRLSPAADHALADAFSRWWAGDTEASPDGFASVGLQVRD